MELREPRMGREGHRAGRRQKVSAADRTPGIPGPTGPRGLARTVPRRHSRTAAWGDSPRGAARAECAHTAASGRFGPAAEPAGCTRLADPAGSANTAVQVGSARTVDPAGSANTAVPVGSVRAGVLVGSARRAVLVGSVRTADPAGSVRTAARAGSARRAVLVGSVRTADPAGSVRTAARAGSARTSVLVGSVRTADPAGSVRAGVLVGSARTAVPAGSARTVHQPWRRADSPVGSAHRAGLERARATWAAPPPAVARHPAALPRPERMRRRLPALRADRPPIRCAAADADARRSWTPPSSWSGHDRCEGRVHHPHATWVMCDAGVQASRTARSASAKRCARRVISS